jgi:hypothetical protein
MHGCLDEYREFRDGWGFVLTLMKGIEETQMPWHLSQAI